MPFASGICLPWLLTVTRLHRRRRGISSRYDSRYASIYTRVIELSYPHRPSTLSISASRSTFRKMEATGAGNANQHFRFLDLPRELQQEITHRLTLEKRKEFCLVSKKLRSNIVRMCGAPMRYTIADDVAQLPTVFRKVGLGGLARVDIPEDALEHVLEASCSLGLKLPSHDAAYPTRNSINSQLRYLPLLRNSHRLQICVSIPAVDSLDEVQAQ